MASSAELLQAERRLGTTLKEKYRLDRVLGVGGMAVVYAATHRNRRSFAIKMLHAELSVIEELRLRFQREGYLANTVGHPGTVIVLDDDVTEDGAAFIVMELLEGTGVDGLADQYGGSIPVREALALMYQLLDVLAAAHAQGIIHRDVKPANLFLNRSGQLKVLDFGIARIRDATTSHLATGTGTQLGTPAFMAPEQALGAIEELDARTDLWAVGATLFTLISGRFVHEGDNAAQLLVYSATRSARSLATVAPSAPASVVELVARAVSFEKSARFPSASEMQAAIGRVCAELYGGVPSSAHLAHFAVGDAATGAVTAAEPTAQTEQSAPPPAKSGSGTLTQLPGGAQSRGETAKPVSVTPASDATRPRKSAFARNASVMAIAGGLGAALWWWSTSPAKGPAPEPSVASAALTIVVPKPSATTERAKEQTRLPDESQPSAQPSGAPSEAPSDVPPGTGLRPGGTHPGRKNGHGGRAGQPGEGKGQGTATESGGTQHNPLDMPIQ